MLPERDDGRDRVLSEELQAAQDHDEEACRVADAADGIRIRRSACVHGKDGAEVKGEGDHDTGCQRREEERPGWRSSFFSPSWRMILKSSLDDSFSVSLTVTLVLISRILYQNLL